MCNVKRIIFKQCRRGLYYFYTTNEAFVEDQTIDYTFLNTVERKIRAFTDEKSKEQTELEYFGNL